MRTSGHAVYPYMSIFRGGSIPAATVITEARRLLETVPEAVGQADHPGHQSVVARPLWPSLRGAARTRS
jgi:hypothetical protein